MGADSRDVVSSPGNFWAALTPPTVFPPKFCHATTLQERVCIASTSHWLVGSPHCKPEGEQGGEGCEAGADQLLGMPLMAERKEPSQERRAPLLKSARPAPGPCSSRLSSA